MFGIIFSLKNFSEKRILINWINRITWSFRKLIVCYKYILVFISFIFRNDRTHNKILTKRFCIAVIKRCNFIRSFYWTGRIHQLQPSFIMQFKEIWILFKYFFNFKLRPTVTTVMILFIAFSFCVNYFHNRDYIRMMYYLFKGVRVTRVCRPIAVIVCCAPAFFHDMLCSWILYG